MNKLFAIVYIGGLVGIEIFLGTTVHNVLKHRVQIDFGGTMRGIYPDPRLTPGRAATLKSSDLQRNDWCNSTQVGDGPACEQTYSQAHREVSTFHKKLVYTAYGVSYPQAQGAYEVDHFYPLCAGGSNDLENLWLEPADLIVGGENLGYHAKDILEAAVCWGIKQGKIDPKDAYREITNDWVNYYHTLIKGAALGGFVYDDMEGDTE